MARDLLAELLTLRELDRRRIVGLMSGTSVDGIDAAVVEVSGHGFDTKIALLTFLTVAMEGEIEQRIRAVPDGKASELCELNFMLGVAFAQAVFAVAASARLPLGELHLIGSHGQTARHQPLGPLSATGSTLQIGEGAVIAEHTGLPVICDFRVADVAAGGQGAPLIPMVDQLLFREPDRVRAMLNLGGIANLTVLDPDPERVIGFDTGPANMALDAVARAASGGVMGYDRDGRMAAAGTLDRDLMARLLENPYISQPPPKSTGHEMFGRAFIAPLLDQYREHLEDLAATLAHFTAESIGRAFDLFVVPDHGAVSDVLVSGGGVHNPVLMELIERRVRPAPLASVATEGVDPDAKEAIGFAVLANEALFSRPGNVPRATGARGPRVLGKLALPPL